MNYFYDLHIHSCLSPCGDDEMTPNNIVNMAFIKGLDIIAITDHNACNHVRVASEIAQTLGILLVPGMEVQTREEVHVLCYFPSVDKIEQFDAQLAAYKSPLPNNSKVFGKQYILNIEDEVVGEYPSALILSIDLGIDELKDLVLKLGGAIVPAHVNKSANSMIVNLGFIPKELDVHCIEVHKKSPINEPLIQGYNIIYNSDAHYLIDIQEPIHQIELEEKTCQAVIDYFLGKGQL